MKKYIYPDVHFSFYKVKSLEEESFNEEYYITSISTHLRKKHIDGVWYLQFILEHGKSTDIKSVGNTVARFNESVYLTQLFGTVWPELKDRFGNPFYKVDKDQTSEEERLTNLLKIKP